VAAAHVQISGGATNNLNVLHLVGRRTAELAVALVLLARNTAAIDQDLVAAGTQATAVGTLGTAGTTGVAAAQCQVDAGNPVKHVIDGKGFVLREEGRRVGYRGLVIGRGFLCGGRTGQDRSEERRVGTERGRWGS